MLQKVFIQFFNGSSYYFHQNVQCMAAKEKKSIYTFSWCGSVFLLPKHLDIDCVLPDEKDKQEINDLQLSWLDFCESCPPNEMENCKKLMILSSATYDTVTFAILCYWISKY